MEVKEYTDAGSFLKDYEQVLLEQEAVSQLILYHAYQIQAGAVPEKYMFGAVTEDEKPLLLFCNLASFNLAVFAVNQDALHPASQVLAEFIGGSLIKIDGINARQDICLSFMEQYKKYINCTFIEKLGMDIMELRKVNEIKPVDGTHRPAVPEEAKLIVDWMIQFQMDTLATEMDYEAALEKTKKLIDENKIYVYENDEKMVVSMAAAIRKLPHGMGISYVYTPEDYRGKGYAAANIYYLSKKLLEDGAEFCTLFVDKKNPLSARAYEKVGYQILEENYEYVVIPSEE